MGTVYTDPDELLSVAETPLITVGDVVTETLLAVCTPAVAVIDDQTKRTPLDESIDRTAFSNEHSVVNDAATISPALIEALGTAIATDDSTVIVVDGEEDLATLPAIMLAPSEASVVYGQPDVGMVHVAVDSAVRDEIKGLLKRMDGDVDETLDLLENNAVSGW